MWNPRKFYFLKLAIAFVGDVNCQVDKKHGIVYANTSKDLLWVVIGSEFSLGGG